jgi:2-polyprenyl-3-methyl-5-hydroxy-6-metoxy-1,4-benzoquinol methylase
MTVMAPACPACGFDDFETRRLIEDVRVRTCRACSLRVLVEPERRDKAATPEFSRINTAEYHRAITAVRQRQAPAMISLVKRHGPLHKEWLDIGCSFGVFLSTVNREGFSVFGIEPDDTACEHARRLLGEEAVYHGSLNAEARPDESADVVSMLDVLEHIPAAALSEIARLIHRKLRPEGLWLIKVPSTDGLYFKLAHHMPRFARARAAGVIKRLWQLDYEFPHRVYFNERSLKRYLERHGFQPVDTLYLEEVPSGTVRDRLRIDGTIPHAQARALTPTLHLVNWIEHWREKSDAMTMLARRVEPA